MGAVTQFQSFKGAVEVSVVSSVTNNSIRSALSKHVSSNRLSEVLELAKAINQIAQPLLHNLQMSIVIGLAVGQLFATLLTWRECLT